MSFKTQNPATGEILEHYSSLSSEEIEHALALGADAVPIWSNTPINSRCTRVERLAEILRVRKDELAGLITLEMGKLFSEAQGEIEKCAAACDYYAENGEAQLEDEMIESDASRSLITYQPLGTILAVMPWNFPFWQLIRAAVPALIAGNTVVMKHASNVPQCALAIDAIFREAGFAEGIFVNLMIESSQVEAVIRDPRIHGVTLTGSGPAGRSVAATAGSVLKKSLLELGGSDPFIVLEDADIELAVQHATMGRFLNCGQSCIAAKRFIVVEAIADQFIDQFKAVVGALQAGDPLDSTTTLAPMAREDLRDELHQQVESSVALGAKIVTGGEIIERSGYYYAATIIDHVSVGQPAWSEELFGPVASIIRVKDEREAVAVANESEFGLGGVIFSGDSERGERLARQLESGAAFVNGMVKSDPRLPFGGIKQSGYGRELSYLGIREFVNIKTLWIR
ncbi:MAG: NAD-dependent succinate-semialdehyde dehydrogenase [Chromatiales bacterium]|nr:NAD-dependent succinate-semialdehyde dehydrogenase [Chromatiales bacterium]